MLCPPWQGLQLWEVRAALPRVVYPLSALQKPLSGSTEQLGKEVVAELRHLVQGGVGGAPHNEVKGTEIVGRQACLAALTC